MSAGGMHAGHMGCRRRAGKEGCCGHIALLVWGADILWCWKELSCCEAGAACLIGCERPRDVLGCAGTVVLLCKQAVCIRGKAGCWNLPKCSQMQDFTYKPCRLRPGIADEIIRAGTT